MPPANRHPDPDPDPEAPPVAGLPLIATFLAPQDRNGTRRLDAGDRLVIMYSVTATTTRTVISVAVADPAIGTVFCPSTSVAAGVPMMCTATQTLSQAEMDAGVVVSQAVVSGSDSGAPVTARAPRASMTLAATGSLSGALSVRIVRNNHGVNVPVAEPGDTLTAPVVETNTGTVTGRSVGVSVLVLPSSGLPGGSPGALGPDRVHLGADHRH